MSESQRRHGFEVWRTQNGFIVQGVNASRHETPQLAFVFESFDSLVEWMRENVEGAG